MPMIFHGNWCRIYIVEGYCEGTDHHGLWQITQSRFAFFSEFLWQAIRLMICGSDKTVVLLRKDVRAGWKSYYTILITRVVLFPDGTFSHGIFLWAKSSLSEESLELQNKVFRKVRWFIPVRFELIFISKDYWNTLIYKVIGIHDEFPIYNLRASTASKISCCILWGGFRVVHPIMSWGSTCRNKGLPDKALWQDF